MRFLWDRYAIPTAVSRCGSVCPIKVDVYSYSSVRCILSLRIRVVFKLTLTLGYHTGDENDDSGSSCNWNDAGIFT